MDFLIFLFHQQSASKEGFSSSRITLRSPSRHVDGTLTAARSRGKIMSITFMHSFYIKVSTINNQSRY
jgi:hypothetical protein